MTRGLAVNSSEVPEIANLPVSKTCARSQISSPNQAICSTIRIVNPRVFNCLKASKIVRIEWAHMIERWSRLACARVWCRRWVDTGEALGGLPQ